MPRFNPPRLILPCAILLCPPLAPAAERPREPLPPIFAPKTPRPRAAAPRKISPETAAKIAIVTAEVAPPTPATATDVTAPTPPLGSEDTIVLDPFFVDEEKYPGLDRLDVLTQKGKLDLLKKKHPGLSVAGALVQREMLADELQRMRNQEIKELMELQSVGNKVPPRLKRAVQEPAVRNNGFVEQPPGTRFRELR